MFFLNIYGRIKIILILYILKFIIEEVVFDGKGIVVMFFIN